MTQFIFLYEVVTVNKQLTFAFHEHIYIFTYMFFRVYFPGQKSVGNHVNFVRKQLRDLSYKKKANEWGTR